MVTSWHGNAFRFTGPGGFPAQRTSNAVLNVSFGVSLNKRFNKEMSCRWFEKLWCSLWRQCVLLWFRTRQFKLTGTKPQQHAPKGERCVHNTMRSYRYQGVSNHRPFDFSSTAFTANIKENTEAPHIWLFEGGNLPDSFHKVSVMRKALPFYEVIMNVWDELNMSKILYMFIIILLHNHQPIGWPDNGLKL